MTTLYMNSLHLRCTHPGTPFEEGSESKANREDANIVHKADLQRNDGTAPEQNLRTALANFECDLIP